MNAADSAVVTQSAAWDVPTEPLAIIAPGVGVTA